VPKPQPARPTSRIEATSSGVSPLDTSSSPTVTVVVPVYNSAGTLDRAIRSVLDQTLTAFELLIVDDGSTDQSLVVARSLAETDTRITVVALPQNIGKSRAMNQAMERARGDWVAILDADDRYQPNRLAVLVAAGEATGVDLVADNQLHLDDATGQLFRQAFDEPGVGREVGLADFISHSNPAAPFDFGILKPMLRTAFLRRTGLAYYPGAKLAEDFYFMMECFAAGGRGWLVHEPLYEWTLPFSPTARRWTSTGSGAWRYDYRNALATNRHYQTRMTELARPELEALLRQRERAYKVMIHYLDAQRVLAETGNRRRALSIIATHPTTWPLLARRVVGRLGRAVRPAHQTQGRTGA
jgi:succinoglycan biosynthesis protein ExoO